MREIKNTKGALDTALEKIRRTENEVRGRDAQIEKLQHEIKIIKAEISQQEEQLLDLEQTNDELNIYYVEAKLAYEYEYNRKKKLEAEISNLRKEKKLKEKALTSAQHELETAHYALRRESDKHMAEWKEVDKLRKTIEALETEVHQHGEALKQKQATIQEQEQMLQRLKHDMALMDMTLSDLKATK